MTDNRSLVGERLPAVLDLKDLARVIGKSEPYTSILVKQGAFDFALLQPAIGKCKKHFSGRRIQEWIDKTELAPTPVGALEQVDPQPIKVEEPHRNYFSRRVRRG